MRLRDSRLRAGLSQQQLADFSTLSVRAIRDIENGRVRKPRQVTCDLLMKVLSPGRREQLPPTGSVTQLRPETGPLSSAPAPHHWADGRLLGREEELRALVNICNDERRQLVTITGFDGVGKTRLATEYARHLQLRDNTPVFWLQPSLRARCDDTHTESRRLRDFIPDGESLLVFDGEQRAIERLAVSTQLLEERPQLQVIITSRDPSGIPVGSFLPLAPLRIPGAGDDPDLAASSPAVQLFCRHAWQLRPSFRLTNQNISSISRICILLDGIPAALKYAAQWALIYSPQQLAEMLTVNPLLAFSPPGQTKPGNRELLASARRMIKSLTLRQRELLLALPQADPPWTLQQAAAAVHADPAECGNDIFTLLSLGLLHRQEDGESALFRALNIVRQLCREPSALSDVI
jgi:DNA-binding XRE family transcriptional regulator